MNTAPLITLGFTAYNAKDTIALAVESALSQTYPNKEIVIVDDCSTDGTFDVLQDLAKKHNHISIFQNKKNCGVAGTRNRIIHESKGEFLCFFDDDDISDKRRVQCQYECITSYEDTHANGAPVICHTARMQHYPDDLKRSESTVGTGEGVAPNGESFARRILTGKPVQYGYGSTATCSQMARLSTYKLFMFDPDFKRSEDTDFNIRAALFGCHFVGLADALVTQTMSYGDEKTLEREYQMTLQLLKKHKNKIAEWDDYNFILKWTDVKFSMLGGGKLAFFKGLFFCLIQHPVRTIKRLCWAKKSAKFLKQQKSFHDLMEKNA